MISKKNLQIQSKQHFKVDVDFFDEETAKQAHEKPVVIFTHGFKGFKDWGGFPYMMEKINSKGFAAVSFNFSHNGVDHEHPVEFLHLDLFAENTFSLELYELGLVIDYFYNNAENYTISRERIGLIGHSRGGGISIIKASEDSRIKCLVTLALVSTFNRYTEEYKRKWKEKGYLETLNTRTNQIMRLNSTLLEDLEINRNRFNLQSAVQKLSIPYLIVHGKEDLSVNYDEAMELYENSNKKYTELFSVKNTGHTFGVVHPFAGTTKAFENVIDKILSFLTETL